MMAFIPPRLRKPAGIAVAGVLFGAAWLVRGGPLWWISIPALIAAPARAIFLYWGAGRTPTRARWPRLGRTSGSNWSACGHGPWRATWPWPPHSSA